MCSHSTPTVRLESALKLVRESATNSAFNVSTAGGIENCTVATGSSNEGSSSETSMQSGGDNARPRKNTCKMTKRLCPFCSRNKANIVNHIITCHSDKQEVKELKSLPGKDKLNVLTKLHRSGMERSNKQTVKTGNKVMKRRKRRGKYQIRCSKCGEFLGRKLLFKHKKKCNRKNEGLPVAGLLKRENTRMKVKGLIIFWTNSLTTVLDACAGIMSGSSRSVGIISKQINMQKASWLL